MRLLWLQGRSLYVYLNAVFAETMEARCTRRADVWRKRAEVSFSRLRAWRDANYRQHERGSVE